MNTITYDIITAVTFIMILGLLVLIHELGHFLTARLFKVRVEEFGLGFPPRVYPRRSRVARLRAEGKTIYSLNLLPLGGFVRLAGENGVSAPTAGPASAWNGDAPPGNAGTSEAEDPGAFANKPAWQRAIILAAGAFNNMALAVALVFAMFVFIGTPHVGIAVVGVAIHSPADQAGILPGDILTRINGQVPRDQVDVHNMIAALQGRPVTVDISRNGVPITMRLVPRTHYPNDQGPIGVMTNPINQHYEPASLGQAAGTALGVPGAVVQGIAGLVSGIGSQSSRVTTLPPGCGPPDYITFGGRITGPYCVASAPGAVRDDPCLAPSGGGGVAGPIGIIRQVGCEVNAIPTQGWVPLLTLVVELSATLAVMNLLPVPALDGGRLLFVLISVVARRRIRPEIEGMAHALGMMALLTLMFIISWHDLMNLFQNRPAF